MVLAAAGDRAFCVGADLKERNQLDDAGWLRNRVLHAGDVRRDPAVPQPTSPRCSASRWGAGSSWRCRCDLIVAADDAVFGLPEVRVGIVPGGGGTQLLARQVGVARAKELIFTGRRIAAPRRTTWGMVRRVAPRRGLDAATAELAAEICALAPRSASARRSAPSTAALERPARRGHRARGRWRGARAVASRGPRARASPPSTRSATPSGRAGDRPDAPSRVTIREVGPRDGLQAEAARSRPSDRARLIDALSATGVPKIEAVSFVSPKAVPAMADAAEVWALVPRAAESVAYSALVPNRRGAEAALEAGGFASLQAFLAASDGYNRDNVGKSVEESVARRRATWSTRPRGAGVPVEVSISAAFGDPYEGDVAPERVVEVAARCVDAGAVARVARRHHRDGHARPGCGAGRRDVRDALPDVPVNLHFHDTRGTAMANVLAAMQAGVTEFDASVGGLGGSPFAPGANGNLATEDLVHMLADMGIETGVDLDAV